MKFKSIRLSIGKYLLLLLLIPTLIASLSYAGETSITDTVNYIATCAPLDSDRSYSYDKAYSLKGSSFSFYNPNDSYQLKISSIYIFDKNGTKLCDYGGADEFPQGFKQTLDAKQDTKVTLVDIAKGLHENKASCGGLSNFAANLNNGTQCQYSSGGCEVDRWGGCDFQAASCSCTLPAENTFQFAIKISWSTVVDSSYTGDKSLLPAPKELIVKP